VFEKFEEFKEFEEFEEFDLVEDPAKRILLEILPGTAQIEPGDRCAITR
jgi:hypothetical protein